VTNQFGTITYTKYHLHLKHGPKHCEKLGVKVLNEALSVINEYYPISPLMKFERSQLQKYIKKTTSLFSRVLHRLARVIDSF